MRGPRTGATIIEVVLVAFLVVIFASVTLVSILGRRGTSEFDNGTKQIAALLREAQSRSLSQSGGTNWGVYFDNSTSTTPYYALFSGSYSTSSRVGYYTLPSSLQYVTSSIAVGGTKAIVFDALTGRTNATSVAVQIIRNSRVSSTISVATSGVVSY